MKTIYGAAVAVIIASIASFSVGDELGFPESIGNLEGGRRRALNHKTGLPNNAGVLPGNQQASSTAMQNMQKKKMQPANRLATAAPTHKRAAPPPPMSHKLPHMMNPLSAPQMTQAFMPLINGPSSPHMTQAVSLPADVPPFRPIPVNENRRKEMQPRPFKPSPMQQNHTFMQPVQMRPMSHNLIGNNGMGMRPSPVYRPASNSVSRISTGDITEVDNHFEAQEDDLPKVNLMGHSVEELATAANVSVEAIRYAIRMRQQQLMAERLRREMLKKELIQEIMAARTTTTTSTTTTTTTTPLPTTTPPVMPMMQVTPASMRPFVSGQKVMNAPKEYYPAGYEKNFDDNFTSKVDLPPTTFHCGDQKHFPGLYADVDLGCMVFHVCALTDDGLIMKSFLCPESTLFDQTVLKCNWWFYVDCKVSPGLYDSNIPISKSYQLMKSVAYFSKYKQNNPKGGVDLAALENVVAGSSQAS